MNFFLVALTLWAPLSFAQDYRKDIQPIFDNRCIACHSCMNGPCQMNLQNYDNFSRGAHHQNVYNGTRIDSTEPTRPGIDGKNKIDWEKLGFFSVNKSKNLDENLFYQVLADKPLAQKDLPISSVEESVSCIDDVQKLKSIFINSKNLMMPYALNPLTEIEKNKIGKWLQSGAPGPTAKEMPKETLKEVRAWEQFFNQKTEKEKLVNRYIYEHIYLAHIYFPEKPTDFYRLVRSKTKCEDRIDEINTRRANDNPGTKDFYYCLKHQDLTIMAKTHMPLSFTPEFRERIKELFYQEKWEISSSKNQDAYSSINSENPFVAFIDIPVKARYQFLLDNAHFIISTFIKGPVCNGSNAVNSIQEQFYVLFINPASDNMVRSKAFEEQAKDLLVLPGVWGSDIKLEKTLDLTKKLVDHREGYRNLRAEEVKKNFPKGYALTDLWNGDGHNSNAMLTVFRHNDNAVVIKGFKGDIPKTMFFLDYALMERLVYNLVVNFDVYGNITHQMLTRIYMDLIRMEAEEMFLSFLPPTVRLPLRKEWYKGLLAEAKIKYAFPLLETKHPVNIHYKNTRNTKQAKLEFVDKWLSNVSESVKGAPDEINFKSKISSNPTTGQSLEKTAKALHSIASLEAQAKIKFPNFFPENSYLIVTKKDGKKDVYTIIKNREHENISWILGESLRLAPKEDTLTILPGFYSFYPNQFFEVNEKDIFTFTNALFKVTTDATWKEFSKRFGVSRLADNFWSVYETLNTNYYENTPTQAGHLDLTRYVME